MLNQVVMVGRITSDPELNEVDDDKKVCEIELAVPRSYKNDDGEYDTDFIPCTLWNGVATNTVEYVRKGDLVGIKGRLESCTDGKLRVITEKITFLSSKPNRE